MNDKEKLTAIGMVAFYALLPLIVVVNYLMAPSPNPWLWWVIGGVLGLALLFATT